MTIEVTTNVSARVEVLLRRFSREALLGAIGARWLKWVNDNFRAEGLERRWPPLAASTLARRGADAKALRDTGLLSKSFNVRVVGDRVSVGTKDKRAKWHHFGTPPFTIRPRVKPLLKFVGREGHVISVREVNHPGLPVRRLLPSRRLAGELADRVLEAAANSEARKFNR